jgi:hypothetical protein
MNENNITISRDEYDALIKAELQVNTIKRVIENDKTDYVGLSSQTESFILSLLDVEKGSAVNE